MMNTGFTTEQLLLVEYERLKDEQKTRIGFRDNLIYVTFASMAAVVAATLSSKNHAYLLLMSPPVGSLLGWTYLVNDEKVSAIGRYIRSTLRPRFAENHIGVFEWEDVHRVDRRRRFRKKLQLFVDLGTFCASSTAALIVYWTNGPWAWPFLCVSFVEVVVVAVLAVQMVGYADFGSDAHAQPSAPVVPDDSPTPDVDRSAPA